MRFFVRTCLIECLYRILWGRRNIKVRFYIRQRIKKRLIAAFLAMALAVGSLGIYSRTVLAENVEQAVFEIEGYDLVRAVKEAVKEDAEIADGGLQLTDGQMEEFHELFQGEGRLLELEPEMERPDLMADMRIFVRVPEDADDSYHVTGDEELLFLFVNYVEEDLACSAVVSRLEGGELLYEETKPVQLKGYEEWIQEEERREEEGPEAGDSDIETENVKKAWAATPSVAARLTATPSSAAPADKLSPVATPSTADASAASFPVATPSTATPSDSGRKDSAAIALMKLVVGIDGCGTARIAVSSINELKAWRDTRVEGIPYEYEDERIAVTAVLPLDTEVPSNAVLQVEEITEAGDEDQYQAFAELARKKLNSEIPDLKLYDISFYTPEGEYIEVSDDARVSIRFKTDLTELNGNVGVLHFAGHGAQLLRLLEVESDDEDQLTAVTFDTEGFSVVAVVNGMAPATGGAGAGGFLLWGTLLALGAGLCFGRRYGILPGNQSENHGIWNKKFRRN